MLALMSVISPAALFRRFHNAASTRVALIRENCAHNNLTRSVASGNAKRGIRSKHNLCDILHHLIDYAAIFFFQLTDPYLRFNDYMHDLIRACMRSII